MTSRRAEGVLVALLFVGCAAVIVFVFSVLRGPGGEFRTRKEPAKNARAEPNPAPRDERPPQPPPPLEVPPDTDDEPVEQSDEPEQREVERDRTGEEFLEPAELAIELLVPAEAPERVVTVVVRDETGAPIDNALAVFRSGARLLWRERTDAAGEAGFLPLESERGPFRVDAIADGFVTGTAKSVAPGAETEIILKARPIVEGVVVAPSRGQGLVKLFTRDAVRQTRIEEDGSFLFDELEEGYVTVQAEVPPYGADSFTFYLHGGTRRYVKLRISKANRLRIYGVIAGWADGGSAWINGIKVPVTAAGNYEFEQAVIGVNEIVVDAPERALFRERFSVKGRAISRYDFRVHRDAKLRGRVRSARTRRPVPNAVVRVGVEFGDPRNDKAPHFPVGRVPVVRTDADGRFEIARLDQRLSYIVSVVAEGYGQGFEERLIPRGQVSILLPEGPFLFGRIRGRGSIPHDAVVTARRLDETPNGRRFNVGDYDGARSVRDARGYYGLSGLLPGTYLLRVSAERYGTLETVVDLTEDRRFRLDLRMRRFKTLEDRDAHLLRRLPPVVEQPPEAFEIEQATLLQVDARRAEHEAPFPGVRVTFWEGDEEIAPRMEFTELEFELTGLPEGSYRAILTHPLLEKPLIRDRFALRRGYPTTIVLR